MLQTSWLLSKLYLINLHLGIFPPSVCTGSTNLCLEEEQDSFHPDPTWFIVLSELSISP